MSRSVVVVGLILLFAPAWAQGQDPHSQATARALFHEGLEHADAEDWEQAEDCFARAQSLRPASAIALNLGVARQHLGKLVAASEAFRAVVRDSHAPSAQRTRAQRRLDAILPRLGELRIELEGPRDGVTLLIDDREVPLAVVGVAGPVDPGEHRVRVVRDDVDVAEASAVITEGDASIVRLVIPELPQSLDLEVRRDVWVDDPDPVATEPEPVRPWYRRGWVWTIVAVGVGAIVGGAIVGARRSGGSQSVCDELSLGCVEP